jgi:hypothetical protein
VDIEVFYLPGDSPELNSDERLNADLKHRISKRIGQFTASRFAPKGPQNDGQNRCLLGGK